VAPQEDNRWAGGYVAFYHTSVDLKENGACTWDYFHTGMIYARHTQSQYGSMLYGTCKVDHTERPAGPYYLRNLINLSDRKSGTYRMTHFVTVNTLEPT
jgi:hypothetical protein